MTGLEFVRAAARTRTELGQVHRFAHCIRVARFAERLAFAHGEDPRKARIAGLLHDLARLYTSKELVDECVARAMPIDAFEHANPIVLHARLGAELARERFGIEDEAILSAIRKHTVAAAVMDPLDTILYLADALEPGRTYADRKLHAGIAVRDLHAAMRQVLDSTIAYLTERGLSVAPQTFAARDVFGHRTDASVSGTHIELPRSA